MVMQFAQLSAGQIVLPNNFNLYFIYLVKSFSLYNNECVAKLTVVMP